MNACALEYCTHGATCDNTGTSGCRTEHHNACSCLTLHAVRDGAVLDAGNAEEVLLCFLDTLGDCCGDFLSLTVANADQAVTVTNDDQCGDLDEGIEDYCISMRRAAGRTAMVEVNVSCPNTHVGEPFTATPEALDRLFTALDKIDRPQPTLVKMPLNKPWGEYKELLDVLAEHNVQGLSIANLQKDRTGLEIPRDWEGGLSGGPCTNASTELIRKVYKEYGDRFAIAGIGGVFTPEQAYAKIRSGSSLVMFISSLMYRGPQQITVLKRGLAQLLRRDGFEHVSDAVGVDVE